METIVMTDITRRITYMDIESVATTTECMNIVERKITAEKEGLAFG